MALSNSNISIAVVQDAISVHSTSSLGALIALAQSGGVGGYAFYIWETRAQNSNRSDGVLIGGASPYWNKWSYNIPAEWDYSTGPLQLRLKRNENNTQGGYEFNLHDFRGYDHTALAPELSVAQMYVVSGGAVTILWTVLLHQFRLPSTVTHLLSEVTIGSQVESLLTPIADLMDINAPISQLEVDFTGVTETEGSIAFFASNSGSTKLCSLSNILATTSFAVGSLYGYITRVVGGVLEADITVTGLVTVPTTPAGNIPISVGTTKIEGLTITVTATSSIYTTAWFNLYMNQTGQAEKLLGSYSGAASAGGTDTNIMSLNGYTLNAPVASNDNISFRIGDLTYS